MSARTHLSRPRPRRLLGGVVSLLLAQGAAAHGAQAVTNAGALSQTLGSKNELILSYRSPVSGKQLRYVVPPFDECSQMGAYEARDGNRVVVDGSCTGGGAQAFMHVYAFNRAADALCLARLVSGERADPREGEVLPSLEVQRVGGCVAPGASTRAPVKSEAEVSAEVRTELEAMRNELADPRRRAELLRRISDIDASELAEHVSEQNVVLLNDLAYYLDESGNSRPAAIILKAVHAAFPDRVVAKLNLADAYWNLGEKPGAQRLYRDYQRDMKRQGKAAKIPARVAQRLKEAG